MAMMDGVMNLCRVKFRDHQRLNHGAACPGIRCRPTRTWATCRAQAAIPAAASSLITASHWAQRLARGAGGGLEEDMAKRIGGRRHA
jgi:hypothetical protein